MNSSSNQPFQDQSSQVRSCHDKIFVPFSEELLARTGSPLGELVPFQLEYRCVRLLDGTYEFDTAPALNSAPQVVHAA